MENQENERGGLQSNANNKSDVAHKKDQANGNLGDPSAKRNIGLNGETQRGNQKDELANLHIGGNEATGYGANNTEDNESIASGPGFEAEGGEFRDDDGKIPAQ